MKFEKFVNRGVDEAGAVESGGAVRTKGGLFSGEEKGKHFITALMPRSSEAEVEGITVWFDSKKEMRDAISELQNS